MNAVLPYWKFWLCRRLLCWQSWLS
jgi:hypothetical protein